jgi:hypothetical protein
MRLSDVFDRLCGQRVNRIDFTGGGFVVSPSPALVKLMDDDAGEHPQMWIDASEEGLTLHYSAKVSGEWRTFTEPLSSITSIR